jgi:hypothetical protein
VIAIVALTASLIAGCAGGHSSGSRNTSGPPITPKERASSLRASAQAAQTQVQDFPVGAAAGQTGQKPAVPAAGAYFGAWVQPESYTQSGRLGAVLELESKLGRRLDIVHTYRRENETFPRPSDLAVARQGSYLMMSWAIDDATRIASGAEDSFIRQRAQEIRGFAAPMFVELQWEMDRPNLAGVVHGPATYVAAWKRVHQIFASMHVDNVSWVWCPTAAGFANGQAPAYYPGNDEVDWVCADAYPGVPLVPLSSRIGAFLTWAAGTGKPAMLGEFGVSHAVVPTARAEWLREAQATVAAHPQVKAVVYFDSGLHIAPQYNFIPTDPGPAAEAFRTWADAPEFDPQNLLAH